MIKVLALIDSVSVSGPCQGLFELIEHSSTQRELAFVLGMFLMAPLKTSPAIEEARRRGISFVILSQNHRYDLRPIHQALTVAKEHKISILQSHGYKAAAVAWVLKYWTGLPWLAFVHGYTAENRRIAMYNRLDRWIIRGADRVIAVSEATKRMLQRVGVHESHLRVVHNGIDPVRRSKGTEAKRLRSLWRSEDDGLLVGVIGRFSPEKGQAQFLRALRDVVQGCPGVMAILIGDGPERARLEEQVKSAGLGESVRFAGYHADMSSVYDALDLVVIPSLSEGLPNVLLEAFLHGKAVIATAVGGIPEVMQGCLTKWLVPPGDEKALSEKIIEILKDSDLRRVASEAGKKEIEIRFSVSQRARRMAALYREVSPV
jgi:glycosyltransferase involved in cell wall biosynthesis